MKKTLMASLVVGTLVFATGCLKDKDFDDYKYGIKDPSGSPVGISIPEGGTISDISKTTTAVNSLTTSQNVVVAHVYYNSSDVAQTDVHVNLVLSPTLIDNYNTANGTNYVELDPSLYSTNLKVTIPKGKRDGEITLVIPNSSLLDPTVSYALGFSIASVDEAGYTIASNLKQALVGIVIKNDYDGIYELNSAFSHPTNAAYTGVQGWPYYMITSGPTSVDATITGTAYGDYFPTQIFYTGTGYSYFSGVNPRIVVDPATNAVTVDEAISTSALFEQNTTEAANSKFYPTGIPGYSTKKTIVAHFRWNGSGGYRVAKDTFVYVQER